MVVRALFSLCAPVRLLERLFHTCARVWRAFQYSGYFIVDLQNFDRYSALRFCFAISCVPQVVKIRKFPVSDSGLCIGAKKRQKFVDHMFVFYTF